MPNYLHKINLTMYRDVEPENLPGDISDYIENPDPNSNDPILAGMRRDHKMRSLDLKEDIVAAFALVVLDEINALRVQAGLSERTIQQLKQAIRNKMD